MRGDVCGRADRKRRDRHGGGARLDATAHTKSLGVRSTTTQRHPRPNCRPKTWSLTPSGSGSPGASKATMYSLNATLTVFCNTAIFGFASRRNANEPSLGQVMLRPHSDRRSWRIHFGHRISSDSTHAQAKGMPTPNNAPT